MLLADRPLPSKQYTKNNEKSYRDCHVIMIVLSTTILSNIYMSFSTIYKFKYPISDHNHKIFKDSLSSDKKRLLGQIRQLSTDSTIANGRFHKPPFIIKRSVSFPNYDKFNDHSFKVEMVPEASKKLCIMRGKCVESGCQIDDNIFKNEFCAQNMNEMCSHKAC